MNNQFEAYDPAGNEDNVVPKEKEPTASQDFGIEPLTPSMPTSKKILVAAVSAITVFGVSIGGWLLVESKLNNLVAEDDDAPLTANITDYAAPSRDDGLAQPVVTDDWYQTDDQTSDDTQTTLDTPAIDDSDKSDALKELEKLATENSGYSQSNNSVGGALRSGLGVNQGVTVVRPVQQQTQGLDISLPPTEQELLAMKFRDGFENSTGFGNGGGSNGSAGTTIGNPNFVIPPGMSPEQQALLMTQMMASQQNASTGGFPQAPQVDANEQWAGTRSAETGVSMAYELTDRRYVVGQGKIIRVTLRTAVNNQLPGEIIGVVGQDVYGDKGRNVLIPAGSMVHGEYRPGAIAGQDRIFAVWTKIRTPNDLEVVLDSNFADDLGRSGVEGDVNRHFFERFAAGALLSVIGTNAMQASASSATDSSVVTIREQIAAAVQGATQETLRESATIKNTISLNHGESVTVFVNQDLDFSAIASQ